MYARRISGFVVRVVVIYALLTAAWLVVGDAYATGFRTGCAFLFGSFGPDCTIRYQPTPTVDKYADTNGVIRNRRTRVEGRITLSSRYFGYVPTVLLVALVLSTPLGWSRRWRALLSGLLLIHGVIALRVFLVLVESLTGDSPLAVFRMSAFVEALIGAAALAISTSPLSPFVIPILVWVPATFRKGDWAALFETDERGSGEVREPPATSTTTGRWLHRANP